jgi:predicted NUDIX family NTP pyrophosphohydrolase
VHPGGPFWANKDMHAWSVAKGEAERDEDLLHAARREFSEETGLTLAGPAMALAPVRQAGGQAGPCLGDRGRHRPLRDPEQLVPAGMAAPLGPRPAVSGG